MAEFDEKLRRTRKGKVVYHRKTHYWAIRDLLRIWRVLRVDLLYRTLKKEEINQLLIISDDIKKVARHKGSPDDLKGEGGTFGGGGAGGGW